jgi:hypothetical protein
MKNRYDPNTIAGRLRLLADELDSAEALGVPLPPTVHVNSHTNLEGAGFHLEAGEFAAWLDYVDNPPVVESWHHDKHWRVVSTKVGHGGLRLEFTMATPIASPEAVGA